MFLEIARFWASTTSYNPDKGRYEILRVMGPDEYHDEYPDAETPGLNNNAYTNLMVVWILCRALELLDRLEQSSSERGSGPPARQPHRGRPVGRRQPENVRSVSRGRDHQSIRRLRGAEWNSSGSATGRQYGDIHRLDRILEAEGDTTNRYKLSKQADVLMLFYLFSQGGTA